MYDNLYARASEGETERQKYIVVQVSNTLHVQLIAVPFLLLLILYRQYNAKTNIEYAKRRASLENFSIFTL